MIRAQTIETEDTTNIQNEIRRILQSVAFAIRTTTSSITKCAPSHCVFGRDMIMLEKEIVKWHELWERRSEQAFKENLRENKRRSNYEYKRGDKVLIITKTNERGGKLHNFMHKGPYEIMEVYGNGTIKIKCNNFKEIIHIRRVKQYFEK